jgi:hypothetical protein
LISIVETVFLKVPLQTYVWFSSDSFFLKRIAASVVGLFLLHQ